MKRPGESPACELLRAHLREIYAAPMPWHSPVKNEPADPQTSSTEGRKNRRKNAGMAREMLPSTDHANLLA